MAYNSSSYYETGYDDHAIKIPAFTTCLNINIQTQLHIIMPITTLPLLTATPFRFNTTPPKFCEQSYDTGVTQFLISYSVSPEFNDPEIDAYDEYDPTPYGGGYNIDLQYGKPLPPSNETCYPRSGSSPPPDLNVPSINGAIVPVSVGGKEAIADEKEAKPVNAISKPTKEEEPSQVLAIENGDDTKSQGKAKQGEVYNSGSGSGRGLYDQVPSGYGLEAMDICESLFGKVRKPMERELQIIYLGAQIHMGEERTTYYQYEDY
ncbi:hypothetical protein M0R45_013036 [Rubus argutus]|uniref:Uncharacterized protein n=1 Tax=Rubus argutus TaxID=59490 RepID=A0AAW1XJF0_RUBAR